MPLSPRQQPASARYEGGRGQRPAIALPAVWSRHIVREWLKDAAIALKWLPDRERGWLAGQRSGMPDVLQSTADLFGTEREKVGIGDATKARIRHTASPEQISRLHLVIEWGWCGWLDVKKELPVVWARACGIPQGVVRKRTGMTPAMQKHWAQKGVEKIVSRMNAGASW